MHLLWGLGSIQYITHIAYLSPLGREEAPLTKFDTNLIQLGSGDRGLITCYQ